MRKVLSLVILIPFISSCASMFAIGHNNFRCQATEKEGMCASVETVYGIYAEKRQAPISISQETKMVCKEELIGDEEEVVCREVKKKGLKKVYNLKISEKQTNLRIPVRKTERVQRIWIYPYVDKSGNFIDGHFIYVVIEEGKWLDSQGREVD